MLGDDVDKWESEITEQRKRYEEKKTQYFSFLFSLAFISFHFFIILRYFVNIDEIDDDDSIIDDPLSQNENVFSISIFCRALIMSFSKTLNLKKKSNWI